MKKLFTMICVLGTAGMLSACESHVSQHELDAAIKRAEMAEARAEAALKAANISEEKFNRMFDAQQRK